MTPRERTLCYNAMQFAVMEATGKAMRETFVLVMLEDFEKDMDNLNIK